MNRPIIQKQPRYENRRLLNIAHEAPCMVWLPGICRHPLTGCDPAHDNRLTMGRGSGYKSHDCFAVSACQPCHWEIDYGVQFEREVVWGYMDAGLNRYIRWLLAHRRIVLDLPTAEMTMVLDGNREVYLKAWIDKRARIA